MRITLTHWLLLLGCQCLVSIGSIIDLTSSPASILPSLTDTLSIRCSLADTPQAPNTGTGLVGRRRSGLHQLQAGGGGGSGGSVIHTLTSLIVTRDGLDIASLTTATSVAHALPDLDDDNLRVVTGTGTGNATAGVTTGGVRGHIDLVWDWPTQRQAGNYTCHAHGIDAQGHGVKVATSLEVKVITQPTIADLVGYIHDMKVELEVQKDVNKQLQRTIDDNAAEAERTIHDLKAELSHIEQGSEYFPRSDQWPDRSYHRKAMTKRVKFAHPYPAAPIVHLGVPMLSTNKLTYYNVSLVSVDMEGFVMEVLAATGSGDNTIWEITVDWTSFPQ